MESVSDAVVLPWRAKSAGKAKGNNCMRPGRGWPGGNSISKGGPASNSAFTVKIPDGVATPSFIKPSRIAEFPVFWSDHTTAGRMR